MMLRVSFLHFESNKIKIIHDHSQEIKRFKASLSLCFMTITTPGETVFSGNINQNYILPVEMTWIWGWRIKEATYFV